MATDAEPNLGGIAGDFGSGRKNVAARIGAKVGVEGIRSLITEFDTLLRKMREVRQEAKTIGDTTGGAASSGVGGSGVGTAAATGAVGGPGRGFSFTGAGLGALGFGSMAGMGMDRFRRNMYQSVGISAQDSLMASMYGTDYRQAEMGRVQALGRYGGTREQMIGAQRIAYGFGMTPQNTMSYLSNVVAPLVQASGGTLDSAGAAAMAGNFMDPMVQRRVTAMGGDPIRQAGKMQNPLQYALELIRLYERRTNVKLNRIDFANMQSPGSGTRIRFKRLFGLSDEAIDTVVQAGMQNAQFNTITGRDTTFTGKDLDILGLTTNRLGLQAQAYSSAVSGRESRFFQQQEGAMVSNLDVEIRIQETLSDVETAFGGILGKLYEFERAVRVASVALGFMAGGSLIGGGFGGLGRGVGRLGGRGGGAVGGAAGGAAGGAGARGASRFGGLRTMGGAAAVGFGAYTAHNAEDLGDIATAGITGAGGGYLLGGPVAAIAGAGVGTAYAALKYFGARDNKAVSKSFAEGLGMSDEQIVNAIPNYKPGAQGPASLGFGGADPDETGKFDVFQGRRGALVAAMLAAANEQSDAFSDMGGSAREIVDLINFFRSPAVMDDGKWSGNISRVKPYIQRVKDRNHDIYEHFFGSVSDPFSFQPVTTEESKSLVQTTQSLISNSIAAGSSGDPTGERGDGPYSPGADANDSATGPTWDNLSSLMKQRLTAMFQASGGRVWLGNGWRSEEEQRNMFLSRYRPDPNGDIEWNGQRWRRHSGAPAAPPGRSMHEIGYAADLVGDLGWVQQNAAKFGLKTFANVNNEPWHVQPVELPNSRAEFERQGGGAPETSGGTSPMAEGAVEAVAGFAGSSAKGYSGVNFDLVQAAAGVSAPALMGFRGTAAETTGGTLPGNVTPGASGRVTAEQVAMLAYQAGFRGQDLISIVAIAKRESGYNPMAHNPHGRDNSYGLTQINMLGAMGPDRRRALGLSRNEELFDPATNLRAAYWVYQQSGNSLNPWTTYDDVTHTDMASAREAVMRAGVSSGDGAFESVPRAQGGNVTVKFDINITSAGTSYDAYTLASQVRPALQSVAEEVFGKRNS